MADEKARQYETAYATQSHLHRFLLKSESDHYISGQRAGKFYLLTSFLYILLVFALFGYAIVRRIDDASAASSLTTTSVVTVEQELSSTTLANIGLAVSALLFGILMVIKVTRPIPYEYAFFVAALWIVFGAFSRNECVCCQVIVSDGQGHFHPRGTGLFDAVNHKMMQSGVCDHLTLITALHSIGIILMISLLYVAIFKDYDYFSVEERARLKMRQSYFATRSWDAEQAIVDASELETSSIPWFKSLLILVIIILAIIPFSCNNSADLPLQNYFIRIILFLAIFLLRLINTYTLRYNLSKFARAFNVLAILPNRRGDAIDERIQQVPEEPNDGLNIPPVPDLTSRRTSPAKLNVIAQETARSTTISVIIDGIISSLVLLVCGWFLTVAAAQVIYEMIVLYVAVIRHRNTQLELRDAYLKKELLMAMPQNKPNNSVDRPKTSATRPVKNKKSH